jgi:hypothetical protein
MERVKVARCCRESDKDLSVGVRLGNHFLSLNDHVKCIQSKDRLASNHTLLYSSPVSS